MIEDLFRIHFIVGLVFAAGYFSELGGDDFSVGHLKLLMRMAAIIIFWPLCVVATICLLIFAAICKVISLVFNIELL